MNKKITSLLLILTICGFLSLLLPNFNDYFRANQEVNANSEDIFAQPNPSGYWNNFTFIHITGSNWTTAANYDWCSGKGTWGEPYVIENITIDVNKSSTGWGIKIAESYNDYFEIRNCTIFNSGSEISLDGIMLENVNNSQLTGNNLSNLNWGIDLWHCGNNTISNNVIFNTSTGILIQWASWDNLVKNNNISQCISGIGIESFEMIAESRQNNITGNRLIQSGIDIVARTLSELLSNYISTSNTVNGGPVYYYVNEAGLDASNFTDAGQILLYFVENSTINGFNLTKGTTPITINNAFNITVSNNNISEQASYGIHISNSDNCTIINNNLIDNQDGVYLTESTFNNISENRIQGNLKGLYIRISSYNNSITKNNISFGSFGISFYSSYNNTVSENNLTGGGILLSSSSQKKYVSNRIKSSNLLNNKKIYYYEDENNLIGDNFTDAGQIILVNVDDSSIQDLNITQGTRGISVHFSNNNSISNCSASFNTESGIYLHQSDLNNISNTVLKNNSDYGIKVSDSNSNNNNIFNNTFIGNGEEHATDEATNNNWDNGSLGNYWEGFAAGKDANDDGVSDPGYSYDVPGSGGGQDNYPLFWDAPNISISSPSNNTLFGNNSPEFTISIDEGIQDSIWYTLGSDPTIYSFIGLTDDINQAGWDGFGSGNVEIHFHVNDSRNYIGIADGMMTKDSTIPIVIIIEPLNNAIINSSAPSYDLLIIEDNMDQSWYVIEGNSTIFDITGSTSGSIDQWAWNDLLDGYINITFHANDSVGNIGSNMTTILKDTLAPNISIDSPSLNSNMNSSAPSFSLIIEDFTLNTMWYRIWNGTHWSANHTFTGQSGTINQTLWTSIWTPLSHEDIIIIEFFANDSFGKISNASIQVRKHSPASEDDTQPPEDSDLMMIIVVISVIGGVSAIGVIGILKKTKSHKSSKKEIERIEGLID